MRTPLLLLAGTLLAGMAAAATPVPGGSEADVGKPGPDLIAAGWDGSPVTLDAVRGNTVLLGFWDSKATC